MKDSKKIPTVVGIDIGAFTAKIAAVERGTIDIITNQANFRETPSVVGFGQGQRKLGEIGNIKLKSNFKNTIISPTRYLGLDVSENQVKVQTNHCPCTVKFEGENMYFKVNANGKDQNFTPQQILACFLTEVYSIMQHNNIDEKLIVFSLPSYFTQTQKRAFQNAAQIAGLKNIKFVSQAIAIGLDYGSFKKAQMGTGKNVVFIDFGHSKFSASLLKFTDNELEVVLERSNRNLGCRDIDQRVFNHMASKFQEKKGLNLRESKRACLKLLQAIQRQRKILSGISQTDITIQCLFQDQDFSEVFNRQILINASSEIFQQIKTTLINFKQEINKLNIKIDAVQLVGGGSRIPKFIQLVQQIFQMNSSRTINSSQTIARGATLAAVQQSGLFRFHSFFIVNRSALSLAFSWRQITEGQQIQVEFPPQNFKHILQASEHLPLQKQIKINTTKKLDAFISYDVLDDQIQKKVAQVVIEAPPQNKNQITLKFQINEDGFVTLSSVKDNDGKDIKFTTKLFKQLTPQQINSFKAKQRQMFVRDFGIVKSQQKRNQLESFIYKQKQIIQKEEIKKYSTAEQIKRVNQYLTQITQNLQNQQNKMGIKDYQKKMKDIQKQIKGLEQNIKKRKHQLQLHFKELQKLKFHAADTIKQITQKYRASKPVVQTCEAIKQIQDWADQMIKQSKTKNVTQLPLVSNKDIQQQYQNIRQLVNQLLNPPKQKPQTVQPPRHQHYQQHYDPQQRYYQQQKQRQQPRRTYQDQDEQYGNYYQQPRNLYQTQHYPQQQQRAPQYYQPRQPQYQTQQQQQQRKRQQQQQQYDPFGMSRSGFFGPSSNNFFGNMSGFW